MQICKRSQNRLANTFQPCGAIVHNVCFCITVAVMNISTQEG